MNNQESDSETDDDYVPAQDQDSSSSEDEGVSVLPDASEALRPSEEEKIAKKSAKDALWASFQASVASTSSAPSKPEGKPRIMVKVEKRYNFAGEDVVEVVEVEEDSTDARKWPLWTPQESDTAAQASTPDISADSSPAPPPSKPSASTKRPGPRKSKTLLTSGPPKAKKLSTLEKSAMDWKAHVTSGSELQDELEANRRAGGYLEKVDFLKRVEDRKEDVLEANRSAKRRKT
ncbi:hypothetical protein ONZ45_g8430 [Pleurotus djamor]|nr:hypothetical protein ONZ45_g8430 [Pleurotus djamor]